MISAAELLAENPEKFKELGDELAETVLLHGADRARERIRQFVEQLYGDFQELGFTPRDATQLAEEIGDFAEARLADMLARTHDGRPNLRLI